MNPGTVKCEAPEFGQHTEEVLVEIGGYSWEEITKLREGEIIRYHKAVLTKLVHQGGFCK